jgi:hypothetical protein
MNKLTRKVFSMTSRFVRVILIAITATILFPNAAFAQTQNTRLVFDINNFQTVTIPTVNDIVYGEPEEIVETPVIVEATKPKNYVPPKVADEDRVYMHEPALREYLCPKMGAKDCEIFIAVLKAENGTHECTRDNRGLNKNGSIDVGLAQINWNPKYNPPYTVEQLRDCKFNLDIALQKYKARGFQPWYAYTKGAYKKFLKPVPQVAATSIIQ